MKRLANPFIVLLFLLGIVRPGLCGNAEPGWKSLGVRGGISATAKHEFFHQYEVIATYGLPWEWKPDASWWLSTQVNGTAGALRTGKRTGFIGSLGPTVVLNKAENPLKLDLGINLNILDKRRFGNQDFGSMLQFGANLGIAYRFDCGIGISYHLQHISNGHIMYPRGTPNPGLDMHIIGLDWRL